MRLSDYIVKFLVKQNIKYVFGITGGSIIHVFDSIGKNKAIEYICTQHEQAAAMAADAYSRVTGDFGVAIATSGPGATNLLTGVAGSYYDSIPILIITGQVPTTKLKKESQVRQIGFQETDVVSIFKPITKYAILIDNPQKIRYELEKAVHIAKSGRPGPVLLDIPNDIQRAEINPDELEPYALEKIPIENQNLEQQIQECILLIKKAKRPIIIFGAGIKIGKAEEKAKEFIEKLRFPFVLTWGALDLFESENILNAGCFGINSSRPGNFSVQNSDLVVALGTKLDTHHTGTPTNTFAREAKKIVLDIDKGEIEKFNRYNLKIDIAINDDVNNFLDSINRKIEGLEIQNLSEWINKINQWKKRYPSCMPEYFNQKEKVNPYVFVEFLSEYLTEKDIIITDTGANLAQTMGGYKTKKKQKLFSSFNNSPMGYALPAGIGACFANDKKQIICITGDGGMQMNIQELATIFKHKLPIKIFIFNNHGYGMIKQTQDDWLNSNYEASSTEKGVAIPDFIKIGDAYGLQTEKISDHQELEKKLKKVLNNPECILCEINISEKQRILPMLKAGRPIEDPKPLLKREEFLGNMIVKPLEQSLTMED